MTHTFNLDLNDFSITFKITSASKNNTNIQFYTQFFNRFPELINNNHSVELYQLFWKIFPHSEHPFQLQDNAHQFVNLINNIQFDTISEQYSKILKEEAILYSHSSARIIFDFIFETTNQDMFLVIDNIINGLNHAFDFDDYLIPWYDYSHENSPTSVFELSALKQYDTEQQYSDYFSSLFTDQLNLIHRISETLSIDDDLLLQQVLSHFYLNSIAEEQNLILYVLQKIQQENNHSLFEIHSFVPINEQYAVNFVIHAKLIDNQFVFGENNHPFFHIIIKALGAYFSQTQQDSNLFIRAINPQVNIMSYDKNMIKEENHLNEIYGFFFNQDFAYGLNKSETKKILEHDIYTLRYKKPKPGTFYSDASEIFSQYATDKAISLILGNIKLYQK